ncbi:MAG: outer membrane beta-barrel protein [Pseudomonadota bacterium]
MGNPRATLAAVALAAAPMLATAAGGGGLYAAVGVGSADADDTIQGIAVDDDDTGLQFLLGYNLLESVSIEGGYVDLGDFDARGPVFRGSTEIDGAVVGIRGQFEVGDHVYLQGRLGFFLWDVETNGTILGTPVEQGKDDGEDLYYGIGGRWDFAKDWGVSLDYTLYETDEVDVDYVSGTLYWYFDF